MKKNEALISVSQFGDMAQCLQKDPVGGAFLPTSPCTKRGDGGRCDRSDVTLLLFANGKKSIYFSFLQQKFQTRTMAPMIKVGYGERWHDITLFCRAAADTNFFHLVPARKIVNCTKKVGWVFKVSSIWLALPVLKSVTVVPAVLWARSTGSASINAVATPQHGYYC